MRMKLVVLFLTAFWCLLSGAAPQVESGSVSNDLIVAEGHVWQQLRHVRDAYVKGKITRRDVAQAAVGMAEQTEDWSQRFVFLKGALVMYCRGGDFAAAEKTYVTMTNSQPWLTVELCNCVLDQALRGVADNGAAVLCTIVDKNISLMRIKDISEKLLADPENVLLHRKIGEQYASIGDWENALRHFKASGGEFARAAAQELVATGTNWRELGDFWWLASDDKADLLHEEYRVHARALYEKSMREQSKKK